MEQSLIRSKLNQNDVDTSDNELDDDDEEGRICTFLIHVLKHFIRNFC